MSQYNPNKPPNDQAYGEESWQLIRDWVTTGVSSYNAWNGSALSQTLYQFTVPAHGWATLRVTP